MKVGRNTAFGLMAMVDVFFPERIPVGDNTIIGYNTTILTHEYLTNEYRLGDVNIGSHVMIGANTTILPGVTIGDDAVVGAGSVVHKDVAAGSFVAGNPLRVIRQGTSRIIMKPQKRLSHESDLTEQIGQPLAVAPRYYSRVLLKKLQAVET